ncbi:MAG: hypothetical protein AABY42_00430 [Nitrospirota bacterium]
MFSKMKRGKRNMGLCLWIVVLLLITWLATDATSEQVGYGMAKYHQVHIKAGIHCEYCHVDPYKPTGWVEVDKKGIHIATGPTNSKRVLDKQKCLECHRWGQKALYSGEQAGAGDLYKK